MVCFDTDYMRGALPEILERLRTENLKAHTGYGTDPLTERARRRILDICGIPYGEVEFLVGGTQTNKTVIDQLLLPGQGVVGTEESHINVHEAGAVEASGHKVITLPSDNGKVIASVLRNYLKSFYADETWPHMVQPGCLYISQPTELGTLYRLAELEELAAICRDYSLKFYVDGARLAYALGSPANDVALKDLARLTDAFYIGGTKCGCLMGEAVVCRRPLPGFFTSIKRHGALLAKGWLLGLQFDTLFADGLYERAGSHGTTMAMRLREGLAALGVEFAFPSETNQQFPVLPNAVVERLRGAFGFEVWGVPGEKVTTVRVVTDWATRPEDVDALLESVRECAGT